MENWNGISDEQLEKVGESTSEKGFIEAMTNLQEYQAKLRNQTEISRIKAGNAIMNWLTEHFLEQKRYYKDEYGRNWEEAMRQDLVYIIEDKEFNELVRQYFEYVIGA